MTNELWYPASPSLSLSVSLSLHFTLYRLLKYSLIPAILNTPSLLLSLPLSLSLPAPFHLPVCSAHSPPCALFYLVPFIWLIWYLELIGLLFEARVFTYIRLHLPISHSSPPLSLLFCLPLFFRVLIMKSGSSPSSALVAFVGLRETNRLLILCLWFVKLTDICII